MIQLHPFAVRAGATQAHLRIFETTDLHVHVFPYDYYADRASDSLGLARAAALVDAMRRSAANSLLFDNGDFLQGSPLGDYMALQRGLRPGEVHPIIAAMNAVGYDAGTLGNHEFNYGLDFLTRALEGAAHPLVCANALRPDGAPIWPTHVFLDRRLITGTGREVPIRIAVTGVLPPQTALWDSEVLGGQVRTAGIEDTTRALVPTLRAQGADLVVVLCHSGIGRGPENAATAVAAVPGVDVVLAGHTHQVFPGPVEAAADVDPAAGTLCGKPAVMAGCHGTHLGVVDLLLDHGDAEGAGGWRILAHQSRAEPVLRNGPPRTRLRPQAAVQAAAAEAHDATRSYLRARVGRSATPLSTHFALAAETAATRIVAEATLDHARRALQGRPEARLPLLAAAAPFKAGGPGGPAHFTDIPPGPLALRNLADLYPFANALRALRLTGAQVADWLERSAAVFRTISPGVADQPLLDPAVPSYTVDSLIGVTYAIDAARPPRYGTDGRLIDPRAARVRGLALDGRPLDPAQSVVVVTNSYRAALVAAQYPDNPPQVVLADPRPVREVLARWIAAQGVLAPPPEPAWRLLLPPGSSAVIETAPDAAPERARLPGLCAERLGLTAAGFLQVRLSPRAADHPAAISEAFTAAFPMDSAPPAGA